MPSSGGAWLEIRGPCAPSSMQGARSSDPELTRYGPPSEGQFPSGPRCRSPRTALKSGECTSAASARTPPRPAPVRPAHRSLDHSTSGTCCSVAAAASATRNSSSHRICQSSGARRVPARTRAAAVAAITASASTASATAAAADQVTFGRLSSAPRRHWPGLRPALQGRR